MSSSNRKKWLSAVFSSRTQPLRGGRRSAGKATKLQCPRLPLTLESLEARDVPAIVNFNVYPITPTEGVPLGSVNVPQPVAQFVVDNYLGFDQSSQLDAVVDYGDGNTTSGLAGPTVQFFQFLGNGRASYQVYGYHTYADAGLFSLTVTVNDNTGPGTTQSATTNINVADQPLSSATPQPSVATVAGGTLTNVNVANFIDGNPLSTASDFTATITWGNPAQTTAGTIVKNTNGVYQVMGTHTYDSTAPGSSPISVTVTHISSSVVIGNSALVSSSAIVPTALPKTISEGATTIPAGTVIGSFTDLGFASPAVAPPGSSYQGAGTFVQFPGAVPTALTVTQVGNSNVYNLTTAAATNVPAGTEEGVTNYILQVTGVGGTPAVTTGSLTVTDAPLTLVSVTAPTPVEGQLLNNVGLMVFSDGFAAAPASDFTATINWGDGSPASLGSVTALGGGQFRVSGTHTYLEETAGGPAYTITIKVDDDGGSTLTGTITNVVVADAPIAPTSQLPVFATQGQPLNDVAVATFTDANPFATAADFSATINWGDGSGSQPAVVKLVGGSPAGAVFGVYGSHVYATSGNFQTLYSVTDNGGAAPIVNANGGIASIAQGAIVVSVLPLQATIDAPTTPGVVATFLDLGGASPLASYSATIDWGDGVITPLGAGVGIAALGGNQFSVTAPAHTYNRTGLFAIKVTVVDSDPASGIGGNLVTVANSTLTVTPTGPIAGAVEGAPLTATVAAFTDSDTLGLPSDYQARINWGDGTPDTVGTIVAGAPGSFTVRGTHTYAEETTTGYAVTVVITDNFGGRVVAYNSVNSVADAALTAGAGIPVFASEQQPLFSVPVGTFTDANPLATAADFSVMINWGDSTPATPGFVTLVGGSAGGAVFAVTGSHVYASTLGSPYAITYTVSDVGGSTLTNAAGGSATVSQGAIVVSVLPVQAVIHTPTTPGVLATFLDLTGADPLASYSATIDWGDGTPTSVGTVNPLGGNQFSVSGPAHTYARTGAFALRVTVVASGPATGIGAGLVAVVNSTLTATPTPPIAGAVEGAPLTATVATFTDTDTVKTAGSYLATIDWGDGSPLSTGTVVGAAGAFTVVGTHTYAEEAPLGHTARVVITDGFGGQVIAVTAVNPVADAALTAGPGIAVFAAERQPLYNVPVGTFTDANPFATAADFAVTINWGDGNTSIGFVTLVGGSPAGAIFAVTGSHVYDSTLGSPYAITYTVSDVGGANLINAAGGTATIAQGAIAVTVLPQVTTIGTAVPAGVVATFLDLGGADPLASYSATIDWGDGTPTSVGVIAALGGNQFSVSGPAHAYATPGTYALRVTVVDSGPATGVGANLVIVRTAPITITPFGGGGGGIAATEGTRLTDVPVASFTTTNPVAVAVDFTATIDWGDGTPFSTGTISQPGGPGTAFVVTGTHTYAEESPAGGYAVIVTVGDNYGGRATLATTAAVVDAALTAGAGIPVFAAKQQPLVSVPVGTFTDANPFATAADFAVTINWGDGNTSIGFVTLVGGSPAGAIFAVTGSHVYDSTLGSPYAITYTVVDDGGSSLINAAGGSATVSQGAIVVSVLPVQAVIHTPTTPGVLATFLDLTGADPLASYSATIDWGDGTPTSVGTVNPLGGNQFSVSGPAHTYARTGAFALRVTVVASGPATGIGAGLVAVVNSTLTATPPGGPILGAVEGAPLTATVAAFTDTDAVKTAGEYLAIIDWGDGSPLSTGTVVGAAGAFTVVGTHTYAEEATTGYTVRVTITDGFGGRVIAVTTVNAVADAPLTAAAGVPVFAAEHQPLNNVSVGTFTDANPKATAADFTVMINWGDGTTATAGFVTLVGGSAGGAVFAVSGSHVYASALGSPFAITYTVTDVGGSSLVNAAGGTATIAQGEILVTALPLVTTIGTPIPAGVVATFIDLAGANPIGAYSATINWGDGTPTSVGTIAALGGGQFTVSGPAHSYATPGTYALRVTVVDSAATGVGASLVVVKTAPITISPAGGGAGGGIAATEGTPLAAVAVATFTTTNPIAVVGDFTATIDWGDGSPFSTGTISQPGGPGTAFVVRGNHTYAEESPAGGYAVIVTVSDNYGGRATLATAATVADATLVSPTPVPQYTTAGHPLVNAPLGTFRDNNPLASAADFTATITWGDGSPTDLGFVTLVGGNATQAIFSVSGTHLYASAGTKTVVIVVQDAGGQVTVITTTVNVTGSQLDLVAFPVVATEGIPTPANQLIGSFSDPGTGPGVTYQVTINWGDGTFSSNLTGVVVQPTAPGSTTFNILAPAHTYAEEGPYVVTLTVVGSNGSGPVSAVNLATVKDAPLTGVNGGTINAVEGNPIGSQLIVSFFDANPQAPVSDFTATIDWGDGTTSAGVISQPGGPGTAFLVSGNHTYLNNGTYPVVVTILDDGGSKATATAQVVVAVAPITMNGTPLVVTGQQNITLVNRDVATFTSSNPLARAGTYGATINWGDGSSSAGTIVQDAFGVLHVQGTHTYTTSGRFFPVVTVTKLGTVGVLGQVTADVTITATPLIVTASPIRGVEGNALPNAQNATNGTVVATFLDVFGADPLASYTVTIDWGNGLTTPGTILPGAGPNFVVVAPVNPSIVYAEAGSYTVRVTVTNADANSPGGFFQAFAIGTATIADAPLTAAPTQPVVTAFQQTPLIGVAVSRFTDGNPLGSVDDFTATIDWGDGSPQSAGRVVQPGGAGTAFVVLGDHTYANATTPPAAPYVVTVTILDNEGSRLTTRTSANVTASTLTGTPVTFNGVEGQPLISTVVAYFTDSGTPDPLSSYTASINWGTGLAGSVTFGQIVPIGGNAFQVLGTYTYPEENVTPNLPYSVTVTIGHNGLPALTVVSQAFIDDAPISGVAVPVYAVEGIPYVGTVGFFTDANPNGVAADFTATITWGDGFTTAGTVVPSGRAFLVRATDPVSGLGHTYTTEGTYLFSVTVTDDGGSTFTAFQSAVVQDGALTATGVNSTIQEGPQAANPLPGVVVPTFTVATFVDAGNTPGNVDPPSAYLVSINWGDGVVTTGTVGNPTLIGNAVIYPVTGQHLYADEGVYSLTVTVRTPGTSSSTVTPTITVTDAPLTAGPAAALTGVEGRQLTGVQVATFTDANLAATIGDFSATINWGDGSSSAGIIGQVATPLGSPTQFAITGTHTYLDEGATPYAITVSIRDLGGSQATATAAATVGDAPLESAGATIRGVEGNTTGPTLIGTFTDSNPLSTLADFTTGGGSITIDWGDGPLATALPASAITAVGSPSGVTYRVTAAHTYRNPGNYAITVVVLDEGGAATIIQSLAEVTDAPLTPLPAANQPIITTTEGSTYTGPVFRFNDGNPLSVPGGFTATINWGDGTTDTGTVTQPGGPGTTFVVGGSHPYLDNGNYTVGVTVTDNGGSLNYTTIAVVTGVAPTAVISNNGPVNENSPATVALGDPRDPSPIDTAASFRYSFATSAAALATTYASAQPGNTGQFVFPDGPSTLTVFGRIFDKDGLFTDSQTAVSVRNVAPTAALFVSGDFVPGKPLTVSFNNQFDPSPNDTAAGFTYSYDFGTGSFGAPTGSPTATFTPAVSGTYIIRGRIADKDGGFTDYTYNQPVNVKVRNVDVFATGAGVGGGPIVHVYNTLDNSMVGSFTAYEPTFRGGVLVGVGDVTGDGIPDIVTGTGPGGGPVVKVFDGVTYNEITSFFAYEPEFRGGVFVTVGDVDGDGKNEIITGVGVGGGPVVKVFNGQTYGLRSSFFAYASETRFGVNVAAGDINGDGKDEIITGTGAGGGPHVKVFNYFGTELGSFFAYDSKFRGGVNVSAGDLFGTGRADIVTGTGQGGGAQMNVFNGQTYVTERSFFAFGPDRITGEPLRNGFNVNASHVGANGKPILIAAAGPGYGPTVRLFDPVTLDSLGELLPYDERFLGGAYVG